MLVTAEEIGIKYGYKKATIYKWARNGTIPSIRIGYKGLRFESEDIERWVSEHNEEWKKTHGL